MKKIKSLGASSTKLILVVLFLLGGVVSAQSVHPKLKKDGKLRSVKHKTADHHNKEIQKNKNHTVEFKHHSQTENKGFSKKKKKKLVK